MKILNKAELQMAEGLLLKHLPKSLKRHTVDTGSGRQEVVDCLQSIISSVTWRKKTFNSWARCPMVADILGRVSRHPASTPTCAKVYGYILGINRKKPSTLEVIVDTWPDFKVIICRPDPKIKRALEFMKIVSYYSTDEQILKKMLREENVLDWSTYFLIGGLDISHATMLKEVSSDREVNNRLYCSVHLLYLPDSSHLPTPAAYSELESRISSLNLSHVDLVNKTWKFGGSKRGYVITNFISNFPSCCITDDQGQPVSWILVYDYYAMGLLYTQPEHRGRGYAKVLISTMARRLHAEGFPVYCFIEEDNHVSYKLFKNLGFTEDPSYRAAWFEFNF